jgi:hypothetical protein
MAKRQVCAGAGLGEVPVGVTESQIHGVLGAHMGWSQKVLDGIGVRVVSLAYGVSEEATVQALQALPEVEFAELDRIIRPSGITPDDPSYPYQWALPDISAPTVCSTTTGSSNTVIAFLDSGVNAVPDLESKFVAGWNFWDNNSTTTDVSGHGTLAAGAASAIGNNGIGVPSPCWGCSIMPVRVSDLNGNSPAH